MNDNRMTSRDLEWRRISVTSVSEEVNDLQSGLETTKRSNARI